MNKGGNRAGDTFGAARIRKDRGAVRSLLLEQILKIKDTADCIHSPGIADWEQTDWRY